MNSIRNDDLLSNGADVNSQIKKDGLNNIVKKQKPSDYERNFSYDDEK